MDFFDLDPRKLPTARLYRVQYDGCMTIHRHFSGLTARDTEIFYTERDDMFVDFDGVVEDHLCWEWAHLSIFISLFANKRHAENRALDWSARQIKASELVGLYVFHADEIRKCLNLHVPSVAWNTIYDQLRICRACSHFADSLDPTPSKAEASILNEYLIVYNVPK